MDVPAALSLASRVQSEIDAAGLGRRFIQPTVLAASDLAALYDTLVRSAPLRAATRRLFVDGHYARAVEEAFKCLNNAVKEKSGLSAKDGADLMRDAFSANGPLLKLNDLRSTSKKDEQRGYMDLYAGAMTGVRNPRAHDQRLDDGPETALELLALAQHLMRRLGNATRARRRRNLARP